MHIIGVIGLGSIGTRHAKNLLDLGVTIVVQDIDARATEPLIGLGARASGDVDAFVIAAPTEHHLPIYNEITAKSAGKPIFMEKPIFNVPDNGMEHILMVGYNLRFHSCVKRAKRLIDTGAIGKPVWGSFVCAQYNSKPDYLRDGVILNWSHEIDLALYLLGTGNYVTSVTRVTNGGDDMTDILLLHDNGAHSSIHLDYLAKPEVRGFTIVGDDGTIKANLVERTVSCNEHYSEKFHDTFDTNYKEEMRAFIDRLDGKTTLGATAADGMKVLDICLKAKKDAGL